MKKILITGMNIAQTTPDYFRRQEVQVVPSHNSLASCLTDLGFSVEHRAVTVGEDLSGYEHVICYIHTPKAYCQRLWNGLYAIAARPDVILAIDDWQCDQIVRGITTFKGFFADDCAPSHREYIMALQKDVTSLEDVMKNKDMYLSALQLIAEKKNRMLVTAFSGGDLDKLDLRWDKKAVFSYNPNPYHLNRTPENGFLNGLEPFTGEKVKEWNFASLVQNKTRIWLNKQKLDWPVNYYGGRRGKYKSERKTEDQMCKIFSQHWGSLMPSYYHAGSGWWRARPLQLADAGSVLLCASQDEAKIYGEAYCGYTANDVEQMDVSQLQKLAADQKQCLYDKHPLDKKVQKAEIESML